MIKQCPGCLRKLDYTTENFHRRRQSARGLASRCKRCCNQANVAWAALRPDYYREYRATNIPRRIAHHLKQAERLIRQLGSTNITETT